MRGRSVGLDADKTCTDFKPSRLALAAQRKPMNDNPDMPAAEALNPRARATAPWGEERATALLVLADGTVIEGMGAGAVGIAVGEVCFNTAMTGYQEILTDPSYAGQIITFTFPHIGNVGTNTEDIETASLAAASGVRGCVLKAPITRASNYRAAQEFDDWLKARGIIAITGVDTRALTALIREKGMPNAVIAHAPDGKFDLAALKRELAAFPGMVGLDLAKDVTSGQSYSWDETEWRWNEGYGHESNPRFHVVAIDYGLKRNILRELATAGCKLTVLPATATAEEVLARKPDGVFLSNGPGDPAATGVYAVPEIRKLVDFRPAGVRHLPRPSDAGARARRHHAQDASGPSRREPSGQGLHHRQGRDHLDESRLRRRSRQPSGECRGDPCVAVRRLELRAQGEGQAGVLGAVPPRGVAGPAGQPLSLQALRRADGREQGQELTRANAQDAQT